jgi:dTDP-4-dehydrorhamnose 3,5-epimerase
MQTQALAIPEVRLLTPKKFGDDRGFFSETWSRKTLAAHGIVADFVQDNQSLSRSKGVLRGLHFQSPPFAQDKLVRVLRGSIFDVAVDIRRGSPTFGRHVGAIVSAANWAQFWVPKGFAHGFVTLETDTEVAYKVTADYAPEHERGLAWDDPALGIMWPVPVAVDLLAAKDRNNPRLKDLPEYFSYTATRPS